MRKLLILSIFCSIPAWAIETSDFVNREQALEYIPELMRNEDPPFAWKRFYPLVEADSASFEKLASEIDIKSSGRPFLLLGLRKETVRYSGFHWGMPNSHELPVRRLSITSDDLFPVEADSNVRREAISKAIEKFVKSGGYSEKDIEAHIYPTRKLYQKALRNERITAGYFVSLVAAGGGWVYYLFSTDSKAHEVSDAKVSSGIKVKNGQR